MRPLRSFRARVALAATTAVALVLAVVGGATLASFAKRERSSLDRALEGRTGLLTRPAVRLAAPGTPPQRPPRGGLLGGGRFRGLGPGPPPDLGAGSGSWVRVFQDGELVLATGDAPPGRFPAPGRAGFKTVELEGERWRTLTRDIGGSTARIEIASNLKPVEERIGELRLRLLVVSLLGVALAAVVARWLAAVALEPLSRLRQGVAAVSSTRDLSRRLPAGDGPDEVDELASGVNEMLRRLERSAAETDEALQATRRFAADAGHELRTPLTSIGANVHALAHNPQLAEEERAEVLAELVAEQARLVRLIDALQTLARGDAGTALPFAELDLAELLDTAVESARSRHPATTFTVQGPEEPVPVHGWPDGLRVLADNLLENAARHGRAGGRVEVSLDAENGACRLIVEDDGPGVRESDRERIFERFARGPGAPPAGSGLGLALVAQQAELHGGDARVDSSPLGGARFAVSLARPLSPASEP